MSEIFVSVSGETYEECLRSLEGAEYAELRLDLVTLTPTETHHLIDNCKNWIIAVRGEFLSKNNAYDIFQAAVSKHPLYADIDFSLISFSQTQQFLRLINDTGIDLLLSYHNYEHTPSSEVLESIAEVMFNSGADAIKITCMANDEKDGEILTGLYQKLPNIIAFGMGEHGIKSRIESMFLGNGITYAAPDNGKSTAPGQLTLSQMKEIYKKRTEG